VEFKIQSEHILYRLLNILGDKASLKAEGYYIAGPGNKSVVQVTGGSSIIALIENRRQFFIEQGQRLDTISNGGLSANCVTEILVHRF